MPLTLTFNSIRTLYFLLGFRPCAVHWQLVEIGKHSIIPELHFAVVSNCYSRLVISKDFVLLNLREAWTGADNSTSLVFVNFIIWDIVTTIEQDDAVTVVIDVIVLDPTEPCFDRKNALWPWLVDKIVQNDCIRRIITTVSNICLIVLIYLVLFNVAWSCVYKQDALTIVTENLVVENFDLCTIWGPDTCFPILADMVILLYSSIVLLALNWNTIFQILLNPIVSNQSVWSELILGHNKNTLFLVLLDIVHHDAGVCTSCTNTHCAIIDITELDLGLVTSLDLDSWSIYGLNCASQNLGLGVYTLEI